MAAVRLRQGWWIRRRGGSGFGCEKECCDDDGDSDMCPPKYLGDKVSRTLPNFIGNVFDNLDGVRTSTSDALTDGMVVGIRQRALLSQNGRRRSNAITIPV